MHEVYSEARKKIYGAKGKTSNLKGKSVYIKREAGTGKINKYNPHSSRMYKKKWKRAAYKKSNKRYKKAKPKYVKKSRKG